MRSRLSARESALFNLARERALFDPEQQDITRYHKQLKKLPAATTKYVVHFTPRSGSSWLTDIVKKTDQLGIPGEFFNPALMPNMTAAMNAATMDQYINILMRRRNKGGVFGCQVTFYQLQRSFDSHDAFMAYFTGTPCFWLLREDIVLQAVSLVKKQQTNVAHSAHSDAQARAAADRAFVYDAAEIRRFVEHVLRAEEGSEALFARYGLSPLRLSYEHNMAMGAAQVINILAHHIGAASVQARDIETGHEKLGTDRNTAFGDRFRAEHPDFVAGIDAARADRLAKVDRSLPESLPAAYRSV